MKVKNLLNRDYYGNSRPTITNDRLLFIYSPTAPKFKSKAQAVRYMIENAEFLA